jgi:TRAP-type C4-dicarboxylate transport system permease small subunit
MCLFLGWHSYRYILLIKEFEDTVLRNVPAWIAFSVLPIAFVLMAYRFLLLAGKGLLPSQSGDREAAVDRL